MNHLNSILLEGVVTYDPVMTGQNGRRLVRFGLVSDNPCPEGKGSGGPLFIAVKTWGALAVNCVGKIRKGMTCRAVGRLRMTEGTGKDGVPARFYEIAAEHVEYLVPGGRQGTDDYKVVSSTLKGGRENEE